MLKKGESRIGKSGNKLILEINNTGSEYFEKAVFYVRPEMSCSSKLGNQAQLYLNSVSLENPYKPKNKSRSKISFIIIGTVIGTAGAGLVSALLLLAGII